MAIYETPGTNFHDLNLDWLISKMKELITEWAATEQDWAGVQAIIDGWPATFDEYYSDPTHQLPETITGAISTAVAGEATARNQAIATSEARTASAINTAISGEVTARNNAIDAAKTALRGDIATAISNNNTTVVNPIARSVQTEQARAEGVEAGLDSRLDAAEEAILGLEGAVRLDPADSPDVANGGYPLANAQVYRVGDMVDLSEPASDTSFRAKIFTASPYEIFSVSGNSATSNIPLIAFLDANDILLAVGPATTNATGFRSGRYCIAPPATAKIIIQEYKSYHASTYVYRGMLSPYSRIMFGGTQVPSVASGGKVFKYHRYDALSRQDITYPFECFQWENP